MSRGNYSLFALTDFRLMVYYIGLRDRVKFLTGRKADEPKVFNTLGRKG